MTCRALPAKRTAPTPVASFLADVQGKKPPITPAGTARRSVLRTADQHHLVYQSSVVSLFGLP
jgi:hypothetical protein